MNKILTVKIAELSKDIFVRTEINEKHFQYLAELIIDGITLPPIKITPDMRVIDGRHRIEAHECLEIKEIQAEIIKTNTKAEQIAIAYQANLGGSLPPKKEDIELTIKMLLDEKLSVKKISEIIGLSSDIIRKYISTIKSKINRQNLISAINGIKDGGLNTSQAAEKYNVDIQQLKNALGDKSKSKKIDGIKEIKRDLTQRYHSTSLKNADSLRKLKIKAEDGDVSAKQVMEIISHFKMLHKKSGRVIEQWEERIMAAFSDAIK